MNEDIMIEHLQKIFEAVNDFVAWSGLEYDMENDEYKMTKLKDEELNFDVLRGIENLHADLRGIGYSSRKENGYDTL